MLMQLRTLDTLPKKKKKKQVQFPASTWHLTDICKSHFKGSSAFMDTSCTWKTDIHAGETNIHTFFLIREEREFVHEISWNADWSGEESS